MGPVPTLPSGPPAAVWPDVNPGSASAWAVAFYRDAAGDLNGPILTVGSDTYDGTVNATLPDDLTGGSYQIVIEGMTDADYAKIRLPTGTPLAAKLYLWWKDAPGFLGDLANFSGFSDPLGAVTPDPPPQGLVAELRVDSLRRRAGDRRYEVVVAARERVIARLTEARVAGACYATLDAAVKQVAQTAGINATTWGLATATPAPNQPNFANVNAGTAIAAITDLRNQARLALKAYGPPSVAIIRDGVLNVGKWSLPLGAQRSIDETSGLLNVDKGSEHPRDAAAGTPPPGAPTSRDTVTLTAMGRPDIKPGDTLKLNLPSDDFPTTGPASIGGALLTSLTGVVLGGDDPGTPATCLVGTVSHRLSRRGGFATTIHAIVLASDSDSGWDDVQPAGTPPRAAAQPPRGSVPADPAHAAAQAIHRVTNMASGRAAPRVAQVRNHPASTGSGSTPPRHTSDIWYADTAGDGLPAGIQRVDVPAGPHGEMREVPYVTPFAWGHYGLVLPRYPGTRVLLLQANGDSGDLVDLGAVWVRDEGPPAEAGDYWLVLPIGVTQRTQIPDGDPGQAQDGPASHDLVDGDGTRVIETKRFVVRVTDQPTQSNSRPQPGSDAPAGAVLIETKTSQGNAQIILKDDGSVTIKGTSITFDTGGQGDVTIKANNVKVSVSGTMDVS